MSGKLKLFLFAVVLVCLSVSVCSAADHWTDIQNAGVIRFGAASDYIPFVYTDGLELDGLDIALVKEMGRRLGVEVKPVDMAFDGLIDALVIGQVDLIGGGFSITEACKELVDYTNAYYAAGGVLVCRKGEEVTENTVSSARIGVMKGTSFEQWIASNLLMGGKTASNNVYTFGKIAQVIDALKKGEIEIALIDEDVYRAEYRHDASLTTVGDRFVNEKYGFASVKGSTLIPELNRVMKEMFKDGTAQKIADEYFAKDFSDRIAPSITRPAQVEIPEIIRREYADSEAVSREITLEELKANNPAACRNGMRFVSDISLPDRITLLPNIPVTKSWKILNTGTCTWDSGYTFNYVKGSVLGPVSVKIDKLVAPGEDYTISVDMTTPADNGEYTAWWQMRSPEGQNFGQTIWYDIRISASSGSADQKVQQGTPKILKWYPDFYSTDKGKCPKLYYEVTNAYKVEFYVNNQFFAETSNLSGYTSLCSPKKMGIYTFAIRAVGETAISDAFQFVDETHYPDPKIGVNVKGR